MAAKRYAGLTAYWGILLSGSCGEMFERIRRASKSPKKRDRIGETDYVENG